MRNSRVGLLVSWIALVGLALLLPRLAAAAWPTDPGLNVPVCTAVGDQYFPRIAPDGAGGAIIVWMDKRAGVTTQLYAQRVSASGVPLWTANGVALAASSNDQKYESIAADSFGGVVVAWYDGSGPFDHGGAIYAQRLDASGVPQWGSNGVAVCMVAGNAKHSFPHTVSDGAGGAIIAWVDKRSGDCGQTDIYAQRISAAGAPVGAINGVAISTAQGDQQELDITPDGAGGAFIAWETNINGAGNGYGIISAQHINASCASLWTGNGVAVSPDSCGQASVTAGAAGDVVVAWQDFHGGTSRICARAVDASGVPQWSAGGVSLCAATGDRESPQVISDDAGGAIATWWDFRDGTHFDTYSGRVSALGAPLWTRDGVALSTDAGPVPADVGVIVDLTFLAPFVVSDGAGGGIAILWSNRGGSGTDIFAQRVNSAGATQWVANGAAISTAFGNQTMPTLTSDGTGGAICVWEDHRGLDWDIYAQRVQANGQLGGEVTSVASEATLSFALDPVWPNPTRMSALTVHFALASAADASLELFDVAGRRLARREVGALGTGQHTVALAPAGRLAPGLYLVRLRQGTSVRSTRVAVLE